MVPEIVCVQLPYQKEMKYVIRISEKGFYGKRAWTESPREEAIIFDSKKEASRQLNRLNGRLWKHGPGAMIEPA